MASRLAHLARDAAPLRGGTDAGLVSPGDAFDRLYERIDAAMEDYTDQDD